MNAMRTRYRAAENGPKIARILADRAGHADLYRTISAGPSGQRADLLVGRVAYTWNDPYEMRIIDPRDGSTAGYASRDFGESCWHVYEQMYDCGVYRLGRANTLSLGVDVLFNGRTAALGRLSDGRRVSPGWFRPNVAGYRWWYDTLSS